MVEEIKTNDAGETLGAIDEVLETRGTRYGTFKNNAEITQKLKSAMSYHIVMHNTCTIFTDVQREAIDNIIQKLGRIANGDPHYEDNWVDIIGYAQLVLDDLQTKED